MSYSLSTITSVAECDTLLANARADRRSFEHKRSILLFVQENSANTASARQAALLEVTADIAALDAQIAATPEGQRKEDYITDRFRKIARQRDLSSTNKSGSPSRIVDDELEIARLTSNVNDTTDFITQVEARRVEIAG
jgi:hypothetical protein